MRPLHSFTLALSLSACAPWLAAQPVAGIHFQHHDWELTCDNTRTCRAAGYQADNDESGVSVMFTRRAGPATTTKAELLLGTYRTTDGVPANDFALELRIDDRPIGSVAMKGGQPHADLPMQLTSALLRALRRSARIEWVHDDDRWHLSDAGAAAALLKMDEFQGRVGTPGALARPGKRSESSVPPALPMPTVQARKPSPPQPGDDDWAARHQAALLPALRQSVKDDFCPKLTDDAAAATLHASRLTPHRLLVSTLCFSGYNTSYGYGVVNPTRPDRPELVTTMGGDFSVDTITAGHKGRGLGDCWETNEWTWTGNRFMHTKHVTTGMCKSVSVGGAWEMPILITDVRRSRD